MLNDTTEAYLGGFSCFQGQLELVVLHTSYKVGLVGPPVLQGHCRNMKNITSSAVVKWVI